MTVTVERALGPAAAPELLALYETYDWWADRGEAAVRRALAATDEAVALRDEATGEGLGTERTAALTAHPPLSDVTLTLLAREGLVPFYEACGFEAVEPIDHPDGDPEELRFLAHSREE